VGIDRKAYVRRETDNRDREREIQSCSRRRPACVAEIASACGQHLALLVVVVGDEV
jgi:hypothetical protein